VAAEEAIAVVASIAAAAVVASIVAEDMAEDMDSMAPRSLLAPVPAAGGTPTVNASAGGDLGPIAAA